MTNKKSLLEGMSWSEDLITAFLEDDRVPDYGFDDHKEEEVSIPLVTTTDIDGEELFFSATSRFQMK